ncbi:acetolactate decarboxylase [Paraburkholderia sp. DHOC27]|uniref:acetolactate decarboxylase n=1 Tax=Paraburkholderia sp. DHOC27 TaxID=2303330 RepID=UPI000E3D7053|nr:acetolactate decarboxylase [Paraburkholderia sp. DHOC27]RFU44398.1 acetolactate decarboxylase [Paraburkholderia sp. DHOC27]
MPELNLVIPTVLDRALKDEVTRTGTTASSIVASALAEYFHTPLHTLFQVSTSGALVEGVYTGAVSSEVILEHGDFGLGTFENLDGEMVVLDGHIYRARGDGTVSEADADARAPFAVVTRFEPDVDLQLAPTASLDALTQRCDEHRSSNNIFYAVRVDGDFHHVRMRAVSPPASGGRLIDAAKAQSEFELSEVRGTLVGLWSPGFSSAFSIAGYHFHFLSEDRKHGGHLLGCSTASMRLRIEALTDFHLALPENESFLKADLSKNSAGELAYAEQAH